jgi:hypothetical protein
MNAQNLFILLISTVGFFIAYFILHVKFIGQQYIWLIFIQSIIASIAFFSLATIHSTFADLDTLSENIEVSLPSVAVSKAIIGTAGGLMILLIIVIISGSMFFENQRVTDILYAVSFFILTLISIAIILYAVFGSSDLATYTNHINNNISIKSRGN